MRKLLFALSFLPLLSICQVNNANKHNGYNIPGFNIDEPKINFGNYGIPTNFGTFFMLLISLNF